MSACRFKCPKKCQNIQGELKSEKFPQYRQKEERLKTFEHWPMQLHQIRADLEDGGFFYTGIGDRVQCYVCGCELGDFMGYDGSRGCVRSHVVFLTN